MTAFGCFRGACLAYFTDVVYQLTLLLDAPTCTLLVMATSWIHPPKWSHLAVIIFALLHLLSGTYVSITFMAAALVKHKCKWFKNAVVSLSIRVGGATENITCSAVACVKDGLGSLWQHGNFNTSQLRNFSSYNDEILHVWLRSWDEHMCQVWLKFTS